MPELIEISLEEILKKKDLTNQKYTIEKKGIKERLRTGVNVEIKFKANLNDVIYVGSKKIDVYSQEEYIQIDKKGFPYYEKHLGPIKYNTYEEIFLTNTCFAAAMGDLNGTLISAVYDMMKAQDHPIYLEFKEILNSVLENSEKIEQAIKRKEYFKDSSELKKFSESDIEIFNAIKKEKDENHIFKDWYIGYLYDHGYEKKIEDPGKKESLKLGEWINKLSKKLESKGFQKVSSLSYN